MNKLEYIMFLNGDIVYIHGSVRVISSCDGYYATYYDENESLQEVNVNVIEGIPITPEILKKNGWKKFKRPYSSDYCYRRKGYTTLNIRSDKEVYFHWGDHDKSITTVHQLQHLLFGLGLNSEMEV